jgi:hypothetical protein
MRSKLAFGLVLALAALARAARGGEVRISSASISSDRRLASFFFSSRGLFFTDNFFLASSAQ